MAIFPSDHYVSDDKSFMYHVELAIEVAEQCPEMTVLLGATPTAPEVGYGWIEAAGPLTLAGPAVPVYKVRQFWEKLSLGLACRLLKFDRMWWNTNCDRGAAAHAARVDYESATRIYIRFMEATSKLKARRASDESSSR